MTTKQEEETKLFAFTIRRTKDPKRVTEGSYLRFLETGLYQSDAHQDTVLKYEKKGGLHCHGMSSMSGVSNKNWFYQLMKPRRGWHVKCEEVYNSDGWLKYITKEEVVMPKEEKRRKPVNLFKQRKKRLALKKAEDI